MGLFDDLDPGVGPVAVDPSPAPAPTPAPGGLFSDLDPQPNAPKPQDIENLLPQLWQRIENERTQAAREAEARDMAQRALGPIDGGPGQRIEDTPEYAQKFPTMPLWVAQSPDQLRDMLNRDSGYDGTLPQRGVAGSFWSGLSGQAQLALSGLLEASGWAANAPVRRPGEVLADQQRDAANYAPPTFAEDVAGGVGGSLPTMAAIALSRGRSIPGLATAAPTAAIPTEAAAANYLTGMANPNVTPSENLTNSIIEGLATRLGGAFEPGLSTPVAQLPRRIGGEALEEGATSTAQDISSQLLGKDATGNLDLGQSLYQGAVGAAAGSTAAGGMSVPSMLQHALGLTPEQAQAAQQAMAQMQTAALEAQAPANAQRVLNPETGEVFTPAMITTPRDEPVSVTPDVINAVQDMPSLLKLFGVPDAAKAVGAMSPESLKRVAGEAADPQGQRLADQESEAAIEQEAAQADQTASDEQVRRQYQERQDFIRRMQDGRRAARDRKEADAAKDAQWRQHVAQQLRQRRTGKIEPDQVLNPYDPQWKPDAAAVKEAQWKRHVAQKLRQGRTGIREPVQFPNPYEQEREAAENARRAQEQQDAQAAEAARRQQIERAQALAAEETSTTQDIPDAIPSEPASIPQGTPDTPRQAAPATSQPPNLPTPQAAGPVTQTSQQARVESVPVRSIADLDRGFREVYRLKPDEAAAATALVRARAAALGEDPDQYAARTIAEVRHGKGSPSLNQRGKAPELLQEGTRIIPRDESLEFPKLLKQYRKANGDRTPVKGDAEWMRLQEQAAEIDRQNGILYQEDVGNLKDAPRNAETGTRIEKGAISFAEDGRAVLHALQSPDVSTAVHELGHSFRRTLSTQEQAIAGKWAGAKRKNDGTYAWGRAAEEKFARAFERYLRDGTAPNKPLQRVFGKLRDWLRSIYEAVKGGPIDIKISPEIRDVFDRMLTPKDQTQAQRLEEGIRTDENRANQPAAQPAAAPAPARPVAQVEEKPATAEKSSTAKPQPTNVPASYPESTSKGTKPGTIDVPKASDRATSDIGRITAEQKERADEQRPELANPGRTDDVRKLVREAREKMADPVRKAQEQSIADGKALLSEPDKLAALRAKVAAGEPLNDIETAAFTELLDREGGTAIAEGGARLKQTIEAIQGYTRGGTEQARALAMRRDRSQTPEERRKSALMRAILMPSQAMEKNLVKMRDQLEKASPSQKAAIKKKLDQLTSKEVERVEKFKKRMKTLGYDLDRLDMLYQKDEVVAAIVDEARIDKADMWDATYEWWMSSILSGPKTQITNTVGNAGNFLANYAWEKPVSMVLNAIPGLRDGGPSAGELATVYKALFSGKAWKFAARHFLDTWSAERPMLDVEMESGRFLTRAQAKMLSEAGDKFSGRAPVNRNIVAKALRSVSLRSMQAVDQFFKGLGARAEVAGRAYRLAKESGYEPGTPEFDEFMDQEISDLESRSWEHAYTEAKRLTFSDDPGPVMQQVGRVRNAVPGGRYVVPFINVLTNLISRGLKTAPVTAQLNMAQRIVRHGLWSASPGARGALPYTRTEVVQDLAASTLGLVSLAILAGWAGDDDDGMPNLTGTESRYIAAKEQTVPAKSIRLFGKYYSYDRLDPFASILAATADLLHGAKQKNPDWIGIATNNLKYQVLDKSFMSSLKQVVESTDEGGTNKAAKLLRGILVGFVPNAIRQPIGAGQDEAKDQQVYAKADPSSGAWWKEQGRLALGSAVGGIPFVPKVDLWGNDQDKATPTDKLGSDFLWRALAPTMTAEGKASNAYEQAVYNWNKNADKPSWPGYPRNYIERKDGSRWYYTSDTYNAMLLERGKAVMELLDGQRQRGWKLDPVNPTAIDMKRIQAAFRVANNRAQMPYREKARNQGELKPDEP